MFTKNRVLKKYFFISIITTGLVIFITLNFAGCRKTSDKSPSDAKENSRSSVEYTIEDAEADMIASSKVYIQSQQVHGEKYLENYNEYVSSAANDRMDDFKRSLSEINRIEELLLNDMQIAEHRELFDNVSPSDTWCSQRARQYEGLYENIKTFIQYSDSFFMKNKSMFLTRFKSRNDSHSRSLTLSPNSYAHKCEMALLEWIIASIESVQEATSTSIDRENPVIITGPWYLHRVIDGDTIEIYCGDFHNNVKEKLRLLSVDTPEVSEHFGREATQFLVEFFEDQKTYFNNLNSWGQEIEILFEDGSEVTRDKYGRLLAYVYADDEQANFHLILEGWSEYVTDYGISIFDKQYRIAEKHSRLMKRGIHRP